MHRFENLIGCSTIQTRQHCWVLCLYRITGNVYYGRLPASKSSGYNSVVWLLHGTVTLELEKNIYICKYICIHIYIYIYLYIYIYIHIFIYIFLYINIHIYIHINTQIYSCIHVYVFMYIHIIYIYIYRHIYVYTYIYMMYQGHCGQYARGHGRRQRNWGSSRVQQVRAHRQLQWDTRELGQGTRRAQRASASGMRLRGAW